MASGQMMGRPGGNDAGPIAWIRKHPDGTFTNEVLPNWAIEQVRRESGAWVALSLTADLEELQVHLARADEENDRLRESNQALLLAGALVSKNWAESRELKAVQEADELRAALNKIAARTGSDDPCRALVQIARDALTPNVALERL